MEQTIHGWIKYGLKATNRIFDSLSFIKEINQTTASAWLHWQNRGERKKKKFCAEISNDAVKKWSLARVQSGRLSPCTCPLRQIWFLTVLTLASPSTFHPLTIGHFPLSSPEDLRATNNLKVFSLCLPSVDCRLSYAALCDPPPPPPPPQPGCYLPLTIHSLQRFPSLEASQNKTP